jgi:hypothetical protein
VQPSPYRLGVGFERCEKKGEKSAPNFVPSSSYHKEEKALKPTEAHCPSNPKPSFKPKREARKETPKPREEAFVCIFYGRAGHLDEFCFRGKRIERRHVEYARNSYYDEFLDLSSCSCSRVLPRSYSRASSHTFSRALPRTSSCAFCLSSLMDLTITHMVLVHERTDVCLDALDTPHVLIVVIISCVGLVSQLEGLTLTLSRDI